MAPGPKVKAAFRAMKEIGIPEDKTKPALKRLLKLYDKNWDLIEAENYRVLADTIFEFEDEDKDKDKDKDKDSEAAENDKKKMQEIADQGGVCEEPDQTQEEPERPLKRLRLKHQGQAAPSHGQHSTNSAPFVLKTPKPEPGEPEASPGQQAQPLTESSQPLVRNKGKQPLLPESGQRRVAPDRSFKPLQIKERKAEPAVTPVQKQPNGSALIKPKDEPFTDDMLSIEPLAVVLPDQVPQESTPINQTKCIRQEVPSNSGAPLCDQDGKGSEASKSADGTDKGLGTLASSSEKANHSLEVGVSKRAPASIDIAASPQGEVKLCLSCDSDLEGKYFDSQDIQAVMKKVNDNCLHKYKVMNPEFSILKVMEDFCEHVGKGTIADGVDNEKSNQQDAGVMGNNGIFCLQSNGSINADVSDNVAAATDVTETDASIPTSASKCSPEDMQSDKNITDNHCAGKDSSVADLKIESLMVVQQQQLNSINLHNLSDTSDLSLGKEIVKVSLEKSNCDFPPSFRYISENIISRDADLIFSLVQIGEQDCCLSCCGDCLEISAPCICARRNGGEYPYTSDGLVRDDFLDKCISMVRKPLKENLVYCKECPLERLKNEDMLDPCKGHLKRTFIKECWLKCGCNKVCGNRVVQRGIRHNLQVFWTSEGKGWGLRALEDLPKGAFICEFIGEILTLTELHKRSLKRSNDKHSYSVLLDTDWGSKALKEAQFLCLDATAYGNVARFINHRCSDANLIEIPIEVEIPSHHYYHVALFTTRKVNAFEELTWDYGVDFDDGEHHMKAFRCLCGSNFCRNMKRSSRSRSTLTLQ